MPDEPDVPDDGDKFDPDELEFDELPGMEPDEEPDVPEPETAQDGLSNLDKLMAGPQRAPTYEWTHAELNEWYKSKNFDPDRLTDAKGRELRIECDTAIRSQMFSGDGPAMMDLSDTVFGMFTRDDVSWEDIGIDLKTRCRQHLEPKGANEPPQSEDPPFGPVPFWTPKKALFIGSTAAIVAAAGIWFFTGNNSDSVTTPPPTPTVVEESAATAPPSTDPKSDEKVVDDAPTITVAQVRTATAVMDTADLSSCADNTFIGAAPAAPPVTAVLFLGQPGADGTTPVVTMFGPDISPPASGVVFMRNGSKRLGFASQGSESFCNFTASDAKSTVLDCDGTFVAAGTMPSDPTLADDFGVAFYQPDASDPSQYYTYGASFGDAPIEEGLIQVEPGGYVSISFSTDGEGEPVPGLDSCAGSEELTDLLQTLNTTN